MVNGRLGLHDPNAPENRRALVTPSALPKTKQEAAEAITQGLLSLASSGALKTRQDVLEALKEAGFEVVRTTKSSISIADQDGGQNIRLKGVLYEQSFSAGAGLRDEIERAARIYRENAESRIQRAREVCKRGIEHKQGENQRRHPRPREGHDRSPAVEQKASASYGWPDVAHDHDGVSVVDRVKRERVVVAGAENCLEPGDHQPAGRRLGQAECEDLGSELSERQQRKLSGVAERGESRYGVVGGDGEAESHQAGTGVEQYDRVGNTVIERVRAATAGLLEKAGRMGECLRGMAEDVWHYATGERETERASQQLEQAGAEFKRTVAPVVERLNAIELEQRQQKALELELEHSSRQRTYHGPSL